MKKKIAPIQKLEIKFDPVKVASDRRSARKIFKRITKLEQSKQTHPLVARNSSLKQHKAVEAARRTLKHMDMDKFWERVLCRIAPLADANERIRIRSLRNAHQHFVN